MVVYYLPDNFQPKPLPHGNSKCDKPFLSTLPSTMAKIRQECKSSGPKRVIEKVSSSVGGVLSATDISQLPRSEQQISQAKRRSKWEQICPQVSNPDDELAVVLHKAFMEDGSKQFIREIKTLRKPAIVVARDQQLIDLVRFCTFKEEFGVMTIDPTFSLGQFDVTTTTYRHLLLQSRRTRNPPVFIGPTMIHYKKTFSTFSLPPPWLVYSLTYPNYDALEQMVKKLCTTLSSMNFPEVSICCVSIMFDVISNCQYAQVQCR